MLRARLTLVLLALELLLAPLARAKPEAALRLPAGLRPTLAVFTNGKGRFLVVPRLRQGMDQTLRRRFEPFTFFGDASTVYQQDVQILVKAKDDFVVYLDELRVTRGTFTLRAPRTWLNCEGRTISMEQLTAAQTQRFIQKVAFRPHAWRHEPHLLARDDEGRYYYVDRARTGRLSKRYVPLSQLRGFRLFIGRRGRAKPVKLRDAVLDDAGQIFLSAKGALLLDKRGLFWRVGKVRTPLLAVPMYSDAMRLLIHKQLGAYTNVRFHTPCDEL